MAYSKGIIAIPKVTGNISITVTTEVKPVERLLNMNRTTASGTMRGSDGWLVNPPNDDYMFMSFSRATGGRSSAGSGYDVYSNISKNSISVVKCTNSSGAAYTLDVDAGVKYTLSWTATGTPRVYIAYYNNGSFVAIGGSVDNNIGDRTYTFTALYSKLVVIFGAGSDADADFTNVSLVKN